MMDPFSRLTSKRFALDIRRYNKNTMLTPEDIERGWKHVLDLVDKSVDEMVNRMVDDLAFPIPANAEVEVVLRVSTLALDGSRILMDEKVIDSVYVREDLDRAAQSAARQPHFTPIVVDALVDAPEEAQIY